MGRTYSLPKDWTCPRCGAKGIDRPQNIAMHERSCAKRESKTTEPKATTDGEAKRTDDQPARKRSFLDDLGEW